jgi:hypothetical protein
MRIVRSLLLTGMLAGLVWFSFFNSASAREVARVALDGLDSRPARSILFIGNSRTYPHDMPYMVRAMADSAGAPEKYQVRMHAPNGRSFKDHWQNPAVRALIAEGFDDVVLQERSGGHTIASESRDFMQYGERLIRHAQAHGARPMLFVGWNYGPSVFTGLPQGTAAAYDRRIQDDHRRLARVSGAPRANVGRAWRAVRATDTSFRLELDGNHPTLHGAYLTALVIYARLSDSDVARVTYVPPGMPEADAHELRRLASISLSSSE